MALHGSFLAGTGALVSFLRSDDLNDSREMQGEGEVGPHSWFFRLITPYLAWGYGGLHPPYTRDPHQFWPMSRNYLVLEDDDHRVRAGMVKLPSMVAGGAVLVTLAVPAMLAMDPVLILR